MVGAVATLGMVLLGYCLKVAKGTQKLVKKNAEVDDEHGVVAKQLSVNAGLALVSCVLLAILMSVNDDEYIALACIRTIGLHALPIADSPSIRVPSSSSAQRRTSALVAGTTWP